MWQRIKDFSWDWRGVLITTPAIATGIWLLRLASGLQFLELAAYDQLMRWRPAESQDKYITIVEIGGSGHSAIADSIYADLLKKLQAMQPSYIGLDIYRDIPVQPGHDELVAVFNQYDNIIGIEKIVGEKDTETVPAPPSLKEKGQIGFNDIIRDPDGRIRRAVLFLNDDENQAHYSLSLYLSYLYLEQKGIAIGAAPGTDDWFQFGDVVLEPMSGYGGGYAGKVGSIDAEGYQMLINYRGGRGSFDSVSMEDVLEGNVAPALIQDRVVLIGDITEVSKDLFPVPYTLSSDQRMPGVEIHAHILSQILGSVLDDRPLIKSWSEWQESLWLIFWTGTGATLTWGLRNTGKGKPWSWERFFGLGGSAAFLAVSGYGALLVGWWIPIIPPFLGLFFAAIAITGYIARTAGQIRSTFGRYLSDEIVSTLLESPEGLRLGGERRTITILTSDLRGFTGISERLDPEEVVKLLNLYLSDMADVITGYMGTIDEFMGDGILVLFGAPLARPDDPERAIACAIAMQLALVGVNEKITAMG
ncbi:MAG: adenylate/guanylate cyclase domain-containing protein, partial [Limnothrix sp.]